MSYYPHSVRRVVDTQMWGKSEPAVSQSVTSVEKPLGSDKPANKHLIAETAISLKKIIGHGEFGVVQQAVWTNEHGQRVSVLLLTYT